MSAVKRITSRESLDWNELPFGKARGNSTPTRNTSGPSTDFPFDDTSLPLFLSDLHDRGDGREFELLATNRRTSVLKRLMVGALVVSAVSILLVVFDSNVARVLISKARASLVAATKYQSETRAGSNQPLPRPLPVKDDPAHASDPATQEGLDTNAPRLIIANNGNHGHSATPRSSLAPATPTENGNAAPSRTLAPEMVAALVSRAKSLLTLRDISAARLLLERAASTRDAEAALLLAQTYDPAVFGVRDRRSITPDPVLARDWYSKAASFGSTEAQERLAQIHK